MTGVVLLLAARITRLPDTTPPVKDTLSTSGLEHSASPASPAPCTTLKTPGGKPASQNSSAKIKAVLGVSWAGLKTKAFPQSSAGAPLKTAI